tara:strand:+ start:113 stop:877 length:765 start_codon:yes stop_codon:yes gene_type:complete
MKIAIPSHNRYEIIQTHTLPLLQKYNFDFVDVFVFVSKSQLSKYLEIQKRWGFNLVEGKEGILNQRNYIIEYFEEGEQIIEIDDDVIDIIDLSTMKPIDDLKIFIGSMFEKTNGLWGINGAVNIRSFRKSAFGSYFICNAFCGYTNDKSIKLSLQEKEDYERCAIYLDKNKQIYKNRQFAIKTKYWKNAGGIDYDFETRKKVNNECANILQDRYPHYFYLKEQKNGIVNPAFRTSYLSEKYTTEYRVPFQSNVS